ncbi:MAG: LysR family transcriptional regulator [Hyphomicrobiaceae bacterium]|nr:LysR family transcriptional regulator [Hyphomicrobiaceae bacterium]
MRTINFDTQLLRSFVTAVDTGSFVAAADQLNMTQPAMSQQMRRLEDLVGQPLFRRDGRKLAVTNAGDMLIGYARQIIAINDQIPEGLGLGSRTEVVHIGMPEHFSESLLPILIARAHEHFPNVQLVVKVARSGALAEGLAEGRLQLALMLGGSPSADDVAAQAMPLQWIRAESFDPTRTGDVVPLVLFRAPCEFRQHATKALEQAGQRWHCVHEGDDLTTLRAAVRANIGVTALPVIQDYTGLKRYSDNDGLPRLPDIHVRLKRHEAWKSRSANALCGLVEQVWKSFRH